MARTATAIKLCLALVAAGSVRISAFGGAANVRMAMPSAGSRITILGPANKPVQLIAGKVACKQGFKATVLVDEEASLSNARSLTYGRVYARSGVDEPENVAFAVGADQLGSALADSEGLIIAADDKGISTSFIESAVKGAPNLKRVSFLSTHGGSRGRLAEAESALRSVASSQGIEYSIVRAGLLKGGGPGNVMRGDDFGLDEYFYNTNPELNSFQKDKFSDQYLLGVKLTTGDSVELGFVEKLVAQNSFSFSTDGNTNRISAATALVESLRQECAANQDFSVSSMRGLAPPTPAAWAKAFSDCITSATNVGVTEYAEGDIPDAVPTPGQAARALQMKTTSAEVPVSSSRSYKLGASTREEELLRKQQIGHFIPFAIIAAALAGSGVFTFSGAV